MKCIPQICAYTKGQICGAYIKQTIAAKAEELNLAHIIGYAQTEYSMTPKLTSRSKNVYLGSACPTCPVLQDSQKEEDNLDKSDDDKN
ncbi:hypothetical protein BLNAU_17622 [Blattamonas nauphoetae]|uniref:Uncharacterized protein n=1 Tax=Blattamonas nauphoetae TaxID=2049346 RepID=A0ABQ9X9V0_9EUKA|nr:hypothetical protein BLNAU_17622 [Blattamonas nauphoetae]